MDDCSDSDEYRESFKVFEECFNKRVNTPHLLIDPIYKILEEHKYIPSLKIAHEFSSNIIKKRRELFEDELKKQSNKEIAENEDFE